MFGLLVWLIEIFVGHCTSLVDYLFSELLCYSFGLIGLNLSLVFQLAFFQFSLQVFVVAHSKSESLSTLAFLCSLSCLQYHSPSCVNDQSFVPFFVSVMN